MTKEELTISETLRHIELVGRLMSNVVKALALKAAYHDHSKLQVPELQHFVEYTEQLKGLTYGSKEYKACLKKLKPALVHHYDNNRHHPEHFPAGISDMSLIDLIEMLVDWYAATKRHLDGDIVKSIKINAKRFKISPQLQRILLNTIEDMDLDQP